MTQKIASFLYQMIQHYNGIVNILTEKDKNKRAALLARLQPIFYLFFGEFRLEILIKVTRDHAVIKTAFFADLQFCSTALIFRI